MSGLGNYQVLWTTRAWYLRPTPRTVVSVAKAFKTPEESGERADGRGIRKEAREPVQRRSAPERHGVLILRCTKSRQQERCCCEDQELLAHFPISVAERRASTFGRLSLSGLLRRGLQLLPAPISSSSSPTGASGPSRSGGDASCRSLSYNRIACRGRGVSFSQIRSFQCRNSLGQSGSFLLQLRYHG